MEVFYQSTRNKEEKVTASQAILKGLSDEGGLFVPVTIPTLTKSLKELAEMSYKEVAYEVLKSYLTDFTKEELEHCINSAYDEKFDTEGPSQNRTNRPYEHRSNHPKLHHFRACSDAYRSRKTAGA